MCHLDLNNFGFLILNCIQLATMENLSLTIFRFANAFKAWKWAGIISLVIARPS